MINLKFKCVRENGDATADYDVTFHQSFTVEEFVNEYLPDRKEWGYVSINGPFWPPDAKVLCEFNFRSGTGFFNINPDLVQAVAKKTVKRIEASGGWSRMDYELYVDLGEDSVS